MASAKVKQMQTNDIIQQLRLRAEEIYVKRNADAKLMIAAADRLEELDERIAIMTEPEEPSEEQMRFPPDDAELINGQMSIADIL